MTSFNFLNSAMVYLHNKAVFLFFSFRIIRAAGVYVCLHVSGRLAE